MCGICGVLRAHGRAVDRDLLNRMCGSLVHRGPDSEGRFVSGPVGLGMRRLSIIDLAGGDQPMFNEDGSIAIVFNGEVYNFAALRTELEGRGHRFASHSDTEVIPHLYEEFGADCVARLNGMFAFALWDERRGELLLARDHLGVKPLYYAVADGDLLFGSEIKALLQHGSLSRDIDPLAVDDFFTYRYVPAPRTIFRAVRKLPPGHVLRVGRDAPSEPRPLRFWDVAFKEDVGPSEAEWADRLRRLLAEAVQMQMVSDVPLGAFLSGGIDSSVVVGLMAAASAAPVKTYSVTFRGWGDYDESAYSRLVAQHFGTDHHEIEVEAEVASLLPRLAYYFDEPMADPAALPTLLMCQEARRDVTVVLTGEGADELLAGYGWYGWARRFGGPQRALRLVPPPLRHRLRDEVERRFEGRRGKRRLMGMLTSNFDDLYFQTVAGTVMHPAERRRLFSADLWQQVDARRYADDFGYYLEHCRGYSAQNQMQYLDTKIWLADDPLTKVDRMSMAVSLEARVPYLDYRLVELAAAMPVDMKRKGRVSKYVLRRAFADLLPKTILERPKHAFDVPLARWLRHDLRREVAALPERDAIARSGYFDPQAVATLASRHLSGERDFSMPLWCLLSFALWHETYAG